MTLRLAILMTACLVLTGCTLVPTDGWPKPEWYWSSDAIRHRKEMKQEQQYNADYRATNSVTK